MKAMRMLSVAAALALAASAHAWQKIGIAQVAGSDGLMRSVETLGEISGNQMLGAMAAAQLSQLSAAEKFTRFFGPMREGGSIAFPMFVNRKNDFEVAVVYPMALPREEFLNLHPGAEETNGLVRVKGLPFGESSEGDFCYVAFSKDGKWAVASDKQSQVKLALKDVAAVSKPMKGDVARLRISAKGFDFLRRLAGDASGKSKKKDDSGGDGCAEREQALENLKGIGSLSISLGIGERGVDVKGTVHAKKGSELAKVGLSPLDGDGLSFAPDNAVAASANFGADMGDVGQTWQNVAETLKRHGLDITSAVAWTNAGSSSLCTVSMDAVAKSVCGQTTNVLANIDASKLVKDLKAAAGCPTLKAAAAPQNTAVVLEGYTPKFTAQQRFAATFPEAKRRKPFFTKVYSLTAILNASISAAVSAMPEDKRAGIAQFVALLPKECAGGVGALYWRDGESIRFLARVSADEIKNVFMTVASMAVIAGAGSGEADADEEGGDDD